ATLSPFFQVANTHPSLPFPLLPPPTPYPDPPTPIPLPQSPYPNPPTPIPLPQSPNPPTPIPLPLLALPPTSHSSYRWPGAAASSRETGGSFSVVGSVGSMLTGLQVAVVNEFGYIVAKDNSALARVSPDSRISGSLRGTSQAGIITVPPIAVRVSLFPWPILPALPFQPAALPQVCARAGHGDMSRRHLHLLPQRFFFAPSRHSKSPLPSHYPFPYPSTSPQVCARAGHGDVSRRQLHLLPNASSLLLPVTLSPLFPPITPSLTPPPPLRCAPGQGMETCPDGAFTFFPNAVSQEQCTACDDDSLDCRYGTLQIAYQNWLDPASLNSTPTTYACLLTEGCSGTTYTGPNTTQCAVGYNNTVPMCSSCADGYYLVLQFCEQCTAALKSVFPLLFIIILIVWVTMNMLADTFAAMDIFLIEVQLLAMVANFNLNFPASWVKTVMLLYNIAAFDPVSPAVVTDIIGPECVFALQFTGKFYATILIPVIGLLVYALVFAHHRWLGGSFFVRVHSWQRKERQRQRLALQRSVTKRRAYNEYENSIVHASLKWLDICYTSVMVKVLEVFKVIGALWCLRKLKWLDICYTSLMVKVLQVFKSQGIGTATVMAAAPQIEWLSSAHVGMLVTSVLVTVVYLVGLPLLFAGVLVDAHTCDVLSSTLFKQRFGWLTERFRPKFWWWHLTNIGMRVLHGCILVFLQQETESQVSAC
ncbi:unnamed protein product, partial [Closterium sp. Yama58-4]